LLREDNVVKGIFPAFFIRNKLISLPFSAYGGLLGNGLSEQKINFFFNILKKKFKSVIFWGKYREFTNLFNRYIYDYGVLSLDEDNKLWKEKLDRSIKKNIKKAKEFNLNIYSDNSREGIQNVFYPLYLLEMKKFGTPPMPLCFFLNLSESFGNKVQILYAKNNCDRVISSLFGIGCGNNFYIAYNPSLPDFHYQRPNDYIHWEMIKHAYSQGYKYFDFGPMRYGGQIKFKEKWGIKRVKCFIYSNNKNIRLRKEGGGFYSKLWKWFVPIWLSKRIGPFIRKKLAI
jgi:lipid II:glycine glycyltransferase (peptidoglycan interpeptide bridge formation enzyme)